MADPSTLFNSEKLTYRAYRINDLENILALHNDPVVQAGAMMDWVVPRSDSFCSTIVRWTAESPMFCVVELTETNAFVGFVSL